jgi:hypothetical protein
VVAPAYDGLVFIPTVGAIRTPPGVARVGLRVSGDEIAASTPNWRVTMVRLSSSICRQPRPSLSVHC